MIKKELGAWITRGKQKRAVMRVLCGPLTPSRIFRQASAINPKISFGDVSAQLRTLEKHGLVKCLTPARLTGKIYCPTVLGRKLLRKEFGVKPSRMRHDIDWGKYARLLAGKTRRRLLLEMRNCQTLYENGVTLSAVRRRLNRARPITLNQTSCAMRALLADGLAEVAGHSGKRSSKLHRLTPEGLVLAETLGEDSQ